MLSSKAEFTRQLTIYEGILSKSKLPFEQYRLYLLDYNILRGIDITYRGYYNHFLDLIREAEDYYFDGQINRVDKIHSGFQSLLAAITNAKFKRKKSIGSLSNRNGGILRLVSKQCLNSSAVHTNKDGSDA